MVRYRSQGGKDLDRKRKRLPLEQKSAVFRRLKRYAKEQFLQTLTTPLDFGEASDEEHETGEFLPDPKIATELCMIPPHLSTWNHTAKQKERKRTKR